ncbi:MAG: histidinol dehydrogenase [Bacteroidales bacterium]|jgi:histidinol dehydrogenase|nr:histidinol dehydrogenase [Bacteroidales bacterium]
MKIIHYPNQKQLQEVLKRPAFEDKKLEKNVREIIQKVRIEGDQAIKEFSRRYDLVQVKDLGIPSEAISASGKLISNELKEALRVAAENITNFHKAQIPEEIFVETILGVTCRQKPVPINKVGLYIPGGSAPLISTVLMLAIPARLAGCNEIILCTPPNREGRIHPAILYAAKISGVTGIFSCGGAQAIAAMAFGTETISKTDKIFGPGNQYVTLAKQIIASQGIAIDMQAGPSEVMILADETANPEFIAADLLSQAEHGPDSQVILVTNSKKIANQALICLKNQLKAIPRKDLAIQSLKSGAIIIVNDELEMVRLSNGYAPEHLILATKKNEELAEYITQAGSVFLGNFTPESLGDYASGTNHTLPTNGFARSYSGLNMDAYFKKITFQKATRQGLISIGPIVERIAEAEQLQAHKNAISVRLKSIINENKN